MYLSQTHEAQSGGETPDVHKQRPSPVSLMKRRWGFGSPRAWLRKTVSSYHLRFSDKPPPPPPPRPSSGFPVMACSRFACSSLSRSSASARSRSSSRSFCARRRRGCCESQAPQKPSHSNRAPPRLDLRQLREQRGLLVLIIIVVTVALRGGRIVRVVRVRRFGNQPRCFAGGRRRLQQLQVAGLLLLKIELVLLLRALVAWSVALRSGRRGSGPAAVTRHVRAPGSSP